MYYKRAFIVSLAFNLIWLAIMLCGIASPWLGLLAIPFFINLIVTCVYGAIWCDIEKYKDFKLYYTDGRVESVKLFKMM